MGEKSALANVDPDLLKDYVKINELRCFPNFNLVLDNSKPIYFTTLESYLNSKGSESESEFYLKFDLINEILINECYLDNIDKYKYISVIDSDEAFLVSREPI